ncbi:Fpg/Nei family DNA glycosylase [Paenibacillus xerothermodurans]|uniref:Fpg/Nei family DNA glycosylase n=1 Tax=Paenibacillus xerothermodurans TaxID=1977292 RepID=A0A2W1NSR6_PAEXE|nr:DNA-formamidopyrimidine glycosylase family protein [Paenibacillus xerothermodurans]PZE21823.1 Fpg/Nei family DNA glycosylase [Paenibacillus xerothermodurans]
MPELPEMENYRLLLSPRIVGKPITGVAVTRERSVNVPVDYFEQHVLGTSVRSIKRRAKHLLFYLSSDKVLVLHLMLGGMLFFGRSEQRPERSIQVTLSWHGMHLYFIGLRLGYLHIHESADIDRVMQKLGPEPLQPGFTPSMFNQLLRRQRGTLKSTLVNQRVISGIGNCYSDEICFAAGLLPARRCSELEEEELTRLYGAIRHVLGEAIRYGGYMEMPLFVGDSLTGGYDERCAVYDCEGEPCVRCGNPVVRRDVASKKSFCCLNCQR